MSDERITQLTDTLRLLFAAVGDEEIIERALQNVIPNWGIMRPRSRTELEELLADMEKNPLMDPREVQARFAGR